MSCYRFNRQELLQKAKDKYYKSGGKEKPAECYIKDKDVIKEKANNKYKNLSKEQKEANKEYNKNRYEQMKRDQAKL